jgi:tetratricopeptide (TPR) repeat protein
MLTEEQLVGYLENTLEPAQRVRVEELLAGDAEARRELTAQQAIHQALRVALGDAAAQQRVKQSILVVVRGKPVEALKAEVIQETTAPPAGKAETTHQQTERVVRPRWRAIERGKNLGASGQALLGRLTELLLRGRPRFALGAVVGVIMLAAGAFLSFHGRPGERIETGRFVTVMGAPKLQRNGERSTFSPRPATLVCLGDRIETGDADKAQIQFNDGTTLTLNFNTAIEIPAPKSKVHNLKSKGQGPTSLGRPQEVNLLLGQIWSKVQKTTNQTVFTVHTPVATAAVKGTEFRLKVQHARLDAELGNQTTGRGGTNPPSPSARAVSAPAAAQKTLTRTPLRRQTSSRLQAVLAVKEGRVEFFNALGKVEATEMTETVAHADAAPTEPKRLQSLKFFRVGQSSAIVIETERPTFPEAVDRLVFPRGWVGLEVKDLVLEASPGQPATNTQVRVVRVMTGSPAQQAGIQVGDVITALDGQPVAKAAMVTAALAARPQATLGLTLSRGGPPTNQPVLVPLATASPPNAPPAPVVSPATAARLQAATLLLLEGKNDAAQQALEPLAATDSGAPALNNLGLLCETKDQAGDAILRYQAALQLDPQAALYHFNLGMALHNIGNLERSAEEFETAWLLAPQWADPLQELGDLYSLLDRPADALQATETEIKINPQSPDFWLDKATVLRKQHRPDEARQAVSRAIELEPAWAAAHRDAGVTSMESGNLAEAEKALRKSTELDPTDAEALSFLGNVLEDLGRLDEAEPVLQRVIALNPAHGVHYSNLGFLYVKQGKTSQAEKLYLKAIEVEPDNTVPYSNLGELYRKLGRLDEAEKMLRKAFELAPDNLTALNNLGGLYLYNRRQPDEAEKLFREVIQRDPAFFPPYYHLAKISLDRGRFDEAETFYRKVIELNPALALAYVSLGLLQEKNLNQPDEAEKMYRKAIELNPNFSDAYNNLGRLYGSRKQWDEAERMYRKAIESDPKNAAARQGLVRLLGEAGIKLDQALALALAALKQQPEDTAYLDILGLIRLKRGELPEAEAALTQAIAKSGDTPGAAGPWSHLGAVDEAKGDLAAARAAYRKALALQPDHKEAKAALDRLGQ